MPEDLTWLDAAAFFAFLVIWFGYGALFDGRFRRPNSINEKMIGIREAWMMRLLDRDNRITDTTLVGHSIRSVTFFASTTLNLIAALVGVLGSAERVHSATVNLSVLFGRGTLALFELKVILVVAIVVYAFFKFTWAIRQFNYFSAVIGSAPLAGSPAIDRKFAHRMALMLSYGFWHFNAGVRAYYYALAALGWFIHPLLLIAVTVLITLVLVRRQLFSATARDIAEHAEILAAQSVASRFPAGEMSSDEPGRSGRGSRRRRRNQVREMCVLLAAAKPRLTIDRASTFLTFPSTSTAMGLDPPPARVDDLSPFSHLPCDLVRSKMCAVKRTNLPARPVAEPIPSHEDLATDRIGIGHPGKHIRLGERRFVRPTACLIRHLGPGNRHAVFGEHLFAEARMQLFSPG